MVSYAGTDRPKGRPTCYGYTYPAAPDLDSTVELVEPAALQVNLQFRWSMPGSLSLANTSATLREHNAALMLAPRNDKRRSMNRGIDPTKATRYALQNAASISKSINRLLATGLALVLYLILSLIYFGTSGDLSRTYPGNGTDPIAHIWFLNWWPWAITHGLNPCISHYVWYPHGFNLTWATSIPGAALLMWPVTWLAGAVVSYNVLTLLAPALSAWTGFLLARYLTRDTASSLIAGYLIGFSSYEVGELLGHPSLDLTFVVPLLVLFVVQRIRGDLSRRRFVLALAAALLVQLGFSTEILATTCVFGAITWAIFLAFAPSQERRRLWMVAGEIILAAGIMVIAAAAFLFYVVKDLTELPPQIASSELYSVDPLNFVIPTVMTGLGGTLFAGVVQQFDLLGHGAYGAYLGLPLILILVLQLRDIRRRPYLNPLYASLLVLVVLSLGPRLRVAGVVTNVWLPWRLALHLPLIHQALPSRFSLYVELVAALAVALWLSTARPGWNRLSRFTLAVLACLCLAPIRTIFRWTPLPLEPFFEPENVVTALGSNSNVIVLPYGWTGLTRSMIWQVQSRMAFTQSGGYVRLDIPPWESGWPVLNNLYKGTGSPNFENDISAFCVTHRVSAILVGPGTPTPLVAAVEALHWPETTNHGVRVVRVPDPRLLHFHYVSGDYWYEGGPDSWMGRQVNIATHGQPMELCITGRYRPAGLGPVEISVVNGSEVSRYRIAQQDTHILSVPANASVSLTASAVFVPAQIMHNGDERSLSVSISLHRESF